MTCQQIAKILDNFKVNCWQKPIINHLIQQVMLILKQLTLIAGGLYRLLPISA